MLRLFGCVLLVAAGALAGNARLTAIKRRVRFLEDMDAALGTLQSRIETLLSPLPDVFGDLAAGGGESVRGFFACLALSQGERPLEEVWAGALAAAELPEPERRILAPLGQTLGRYDVGRQSAEIGLVREGLRHLAASLRGEIAVRGRGYVGLGASAGALLALLLL
ncbi:MAG: stage III sporulation protein AB [Oscillospiraceae bacterium]